MIADKPRPSGQHVEAIREKLLTKRNQWSDEDAPQKDTISSSFKFQRKQQQQEHQNVT
jgi:hypothetical protein